ncbi:MAG: tetratricopeptide repeat protein, partial [Gemmatimonadales bacterium]
MATRAALITVLLLCSAGGVVAQNETRPDVRLELRRIETLERSGQLAEAAMALEDMLRRAPAQPGALLAYERVCRRLGQLDRVIPVVARAIGRDPESALLRQVQLRVLAELGDTEGLREAGRLWLETAPGSDSAYREYAAALLRVGALGEAEAILRQGAREAERPLALAVDLANLYQEQRRWSEAAEQWVLVLRSSPDLGWDLINFKLRTQGPEADAAAAALLRQLADGTTSLRERELAAIAALYVGAEEEARRRAESLLEELEARERQAFINDFAEVAANQVRPGTVAWAYRQLLREVPGDSMRWDLARQIVQSDLSAGDTVAAVNLLDELVDDGEVGAAAHGWASGLRIRLLASLGDLDQARRALESYAADYAERREFPPIALAVADEYMRRGRLNDAVAILALIPVDRDLDPGTQARVSRSRGFLALYTGRYDEARAELEVAAALMSGEGRGEVLRVLGFLRAANRPELEAVSAAYRATAKERRREALQSLLDGLEES